MRLRSRLVRRVLFGLIVAIMVLGTTVGPNSTVFSYVQLLLFHPLFVLILLGLYVLRPVILVPLGGLHVVAGFVFGGFQGVVIALAGTIFTALPVFWVGMYFRPTTGIGGWLVRSWESTFTITGDLPGTISASLSPVPADAVAYAAGAAGVAPRVFLIGLIVGEVPWVAAYVLIGHSMTTLSTVGAADLVSLVIALALLSLLVVVRPVLGELRDRREES